MDDVKNELSINKQYYEWLREDVLVWIDDGTTHVLSVGCGGGVTEAELVKRGVQVTGIEPQPEAAERARARGLTVFTESAENCSAILTDQQFDCLIFSDVLEHIPDPTSIISGYSRFLKPGGRVIVSVPNFRHYSVFHSLWIKGEIQYTNAGILDRTHIRLTTRKMVSRWFSECGLEQCHVDYRILRRRDKLINRMSLGILREFLATQIIVVGNKAEEYTLQSGVERV